VLPADLRRASRIAVILNRIPAFDVRDAEERSVADRVRIPIERSTLTGCGRSVDEGQGRAMSGDWCAAGVAIDHIQAGELAEQDDAARHRVL